MLLAHLLLRKVFIDSEQSFWFSCIVFSSLKRHPTPTLKNSWDSYDRYFDLLISLYDFNLFDNMESQCSSYPSCYPRKRYLIPRILCSCWSYRCVKSKPVQKINITSIFNMRQILGPLRPVL